MVSEGALYETEKHRQALGETYATRLIGQICSVTPTFSTTAVAE